MNEFLAWALLIIGTLAVAGWPIYFFKVSNPLRTPIGRLMVLYTCVAPITVYARSWIGVIANHGIVGTSVGSLITGAMITGIFVATPFVYSYVERQSRRKKGEK